MPKNHVPTADRVAARKAREAKENETVEEAADQWPFGAFWLAINRDLLRNDLPELRFKDAREVWEAAQSDAEQRAVEWVKKVR